MIGQRMLDRPEGAGASRSNHLHHLVVASRWLLLPTLIMVVMEFAQVWYFSAGEDGGVVRGAGDEVFRKLVWLAAVASLAGHFARCGFAPLLTILAPFLPFIGWGAFVTVLWAADPVLGVRTLIFWSLAAGVAAAAGADLPPRLLARVLAFVVTAIVLASFAMLVVAPEAAITQYGTNATVRGLFPHKNTFGWFCAVGVIFVWAMRHELGRPQTALALPLLFAAMLAANSKTALGVAGAGIAYITFLEILPRLFWNGARAFLAMVTLLILGAATVTFLVPLLLDLAGRDASLTGRTEVWAHYFSYAIERPLTGFGPGTFSSDTLTNIRIGGTVPGLEDQHLHSPHSLYLGVFGEVGIIGLLLFVLCHLYLATVPPFERLSASTRLPAALAFSILLAGITEMRDGYSLGVASILLVTARGAALSAAARKV